MYNYLKRLWIILLLALFCVAVGGAGAAEKQVWPLVVDLLHNDGDIASLWHDAGDVYIWNTKGRLYVYIVPDEDKSIREVAIHVVADSPDFSAVMDKKDVPKASLFDFKTDYLGDQGKPVSSHLEEMVLDSPSWGKGPNNRYIIVQAELSVLLGLDEEGNEIWAQLPEACFAGSSEVFGSLDASTAAGVDWGYYVTYPLAKVEPGHFIDANVNGLAFSTVTQEGITGEEGQFWFIPGEMVDFFVGNLKLGEAYGDRSISPVDFFAGADMDDDRVINMAWLLQSLDADGSPGLGAINISGEVAACLNGALDDGVLAEFPQPLSLEAFYASTSMVQSLIEATQNSCPVALTPLTREEARENLVSGQKAGNLMKKNISKSADMKSDKAKIEIMPVYVPARRSDGSATEVSYYGAEGELLETRNLAKPIVVSYLDEVEGTGTSDVFVAISRDDGETWKRRNISRTADKSSLLGFPGESQKPMLKVKDNMIFLAWTDKYCRGGRPGYAIEVCADSDGDGLADPCEICRQTAEGEVCLPDYPGDDAYWQDNLYGVGGPQRSVLYEENPELGEVPYSCVWTARGVIEPSSGDIVWYKPERLTSGRRDAYQLFAGAGEDVAFAIVWQEDPKGLLPGDGAGPGDGWSGANTNNKTDIWYSYITMADFAKFDPYYPREGHGDNADLVDTDPELAGRLKALVPMSLPVRISDNEVCHAENMDPDGGQGEHDYDEEGEGTHGYCGTLEGIGTAAAPGSNPLCAYTVEKANPKGEIHHICVTADGRFLDGNTGASRPNIFLMPYKKADGSKGAWAIIGYEESKGVGIPPDGDHEEDSCGDTTVTSSTDEHDEDRYKPDSGKNVIYHSFDFAKPETVNGGGIINLPETDEAGNPVYLVDEFGDPLLDWKGEPQLNYENARRIRFLPQPKSKAGDSGTVLVALYRQGEEGRGKPADIFLRRMVSTTPGNPYAFKNFKPGAQNISSVEPTELFQDPFDPAAPVKMLRWAWSLENLNDSSAKNPYTDARAHRGSLVGDELLIGYTLTPNWGRRANDKYDLFIRRSFDGGQSWTTDPAAPGPIEHDVVFRKPVIDELNQTVTWEEEVVTTSYDPGGQEPPRNVSNLRNNRISVLEPRLVKTPGTILTDGVALYPEDVQDTSAYQLAWGVEFNQNQAPSDVVFPKIPLDIYYGRTQDKGQGYESVQVTQQSGSGAPQDGWNLLAKDRPEQGAAQIRQTPDGSRLYGIWLEEGEGGSDIMFRRVDYR